MNLIQQWLASDQNYSEGVELYCLHGESEFLKKLFLQRKTDFNKRKLVVEMKELVIEPVKEVTIVEPEEENPVKNYPRNVEAIRREAKEHYRAAGPLHRHGLHADTKAERFEAVSKLKYHMKSNMECFVKVEYFNKHGVLPPDLSKIQGFEHLKDLTREEMKNTLLNHRSYISKNKNKLVNMDGERKENLENKISQRLAEKEYLETALNA